MSPSLRLLVWGAAITAALALAVLAVATALGLAVACGRLWGGGWLRGGLAGLQALVRGVPLLVLLIGSYFSLPYLGIDLPLYGVAIMVMGTYFAAYMAEVFRGAIDSVPRGQWETGRSLGLRWWMTAVLIILPQARRPGTAPYLNTALSVVKNTSLVSAIGGWEMAAAGREMGDRTGDVLTAYLAVAAGYFILCFPLSRLAAWVEAKDDATLVRIEP